MPKLESVNVKGFGVIGSSKIYLPYWYILQSSMISDFLQVGDRQYGALYSFQTRMYI